MARNAKRRNSWDDDEWGDDDYEQRKRNKRKGFRQMRKDKIHQKHASIEDVNDEFNPLFED